MLAHVVKGSHIMANEDQIKQPSRRDFIDIRIHIIKQYSDFPVTSLLHRSGTLTGEDYLPRAWQQTLPPSVPSSW